MFLNSEIICNYNEAYEISQSHLHRLMDQVFENNIFLRELDIFDPEETFYLKISYGKSPGKIMDYSKNTPHFFKYDRTSFDYLTSINDVIPNVVNSGNQKYISTDICRYLT